MMRSLYSAISGLKNHQVKMDVIGNNIANVNTTGFKRSRVTFATMLSQTMKGASSPSANQGGTNAIQVGLGSMLGSIDQIMTQGSSQSTGKDTDLMLQGSGFFVLKDGAQTVYTRAGGFGFDKNGTLEDPGTGAKVQGFTWGADDSTDPDWTKIGQIKFALGDALPLDQNLPVNLSTAAETSGSWSAGSPSTIIDPALVGVGNIEIAGMTQVSGTPGTGEFSFDPATGTITLSAAPTADVDVKYAPFPMTGDGTTTTYTVNYPPSSGAIVYDNGQAPPIEYTLAADKSNIGPNEYWVDTTGGKYQITFGTAPSGQIGYNFVNQPHTLESFSIDQSGVITGVYSNGQDSVTHKIAQVAIAKFSNDAGLQNIGGNFYTTSNNSGNPDVGAAGEDGRATILPDAVEMSNVDLSQEFTDMIVAQRGFQANSRVITVSDSLLQELIDLKRQ